MGGTIMDFNKSVWTKRKAVSISGSRDTQTSADTDVGGICTHSILLSIESLQRQGLQSYPVKKLFKETLVQDEAVFSSEQDITLNRSAGCMQMGIPWPLIPKTPYTAPYQRPSSNGILSVLHARNFGDLSNKTSTTTAAPVDAQALYLDMRVAAPRSSSARSPRQVHPSLQPLLSSPAGTGSKSLVASQPHFTTLPNNVSARASVAAGAHQPSSSGPCLPALRSIQAGAYGHSSSGPSLQAAWPPAISGRPPIPAYHDPKAGQLSSSRSARYPTLSTPTLGTPVMPPPKQWVLQQQQQQKQQAVYRRATH